MIPRAPGRPWVLRVATSRWSAAGCGRASLASFATPADGVVLLRTRFPAKAPTSPPQRPVVFLHGLLGSSSNFRSLAVAPELNTSRTVLTADLRNHGRSPHSNEPMTFDRMAADVARLIQDEDLGRCHLVGHSLGGKVAMAVGLLFPECLQSLVVVDIAPVPYDTRHPNWLEVADVVSATATLDPSRYKTREEIDAELALRVNLLPIHGGGYRWRMNTKVLIRDLNRMADFWESPPKHPCAVPTLFLRGSESGYVNPANEPSFKRLFVDSRVETIAGAGHWVHADRPKEFAHAVSAFIDAHER